MVAVLEHSQRISRLTPLADALGRIDRFVGPVAPRRIDLGAAAGCVLAADLNVASPAPSGPVALRDGWAVRSEETVDAGTYAAAALAQAPVRIETGDQLPAGTDAVAETDVVRQRGSGWEALARVAPGDGVLPPGADASPDEPFMRAGRVLRRTDIASLQALDVTTIDVREPRIRLAPARIDVRLSILAGCLADLTRADGAAVDLVAAANADLAPAGERADLLVLIGGTGSGVRDRSVQALARAGRVDFHGIALAPGETAAFGTIGQTPVLIVPGRLDAALAVWLTLGRRIIARLGGRRQPEPTVAGLLSRKVASSLGLAELVLLRREGDAVAPIAGGYLSFSALAQADGYMLVPPESEGYPAGARVEMRALP